MAEALMILTRRALLGSAALAPVLLSRAGEAAPAHIAVTKGTGCECCEGWAKHLRANGYSVSVTETDDLEAVKAKLGIPEDLRTCHTGQVGDYLLEGHVPAVAVADLLRDKPDGMIGLAVPGMPVGSPGMEVKGAKLDEYSVILFGPAGRRVWGKFKGASRVASAFPSLRDPA